MPRLGHRAEMWCLLKYITCGLRVLKAGQAGKSLPLGSPCLAKFTQ